MGSSWTGDTGRDGPGTPVIVLKIKDKNGCLSLLHMHILR